MTGDPGAGPTGGADRATKRRALTAVCAALFLTLLDSTVAGLALPEIQADLGVDYSTGQWVLSSYILVFASLLLIGGALGDRLGRRRVFLAGMSAFVLGALVAACSPTIGVLVAGRALQALGAAAVTPQSPAILVSTFTDRAGQARAFGLWSGMSGLALLVGPLLGGAAVQLAGWRSAFLLYVPVALVALVLGRRLPADPPVNRAVPLHLGALALSVVGLGTMVYALVEGDQLGWTSPVVLGLAAVALVSWVLLVIGQGRAVAPVLRPALLRIRAVRGATTIAFLVAFAQNLVFVLLSLSLQQVQGRSPFEAGQRLLPVMVAVVLAAMLVGRLSVRFGTRISVTVGTALAGTSLVVLAVVGIDGPYPTWAPLLFTFGAGMGLIMAPNNQALMTGAPPDAKSQTSAMNGVGQQLGSLIGVAGLGVVLATASGGTGSETVGLSTGLPGALVAAGAFLLLAAVVALRCHPRKAAEHARSEPAPSARPAQT